MMSDRHVDFGLGKSYVKKTQTVLSTTLGGVSWDIDHIRLINLICATPNSSFPSKSFAARSIHHSFWDQRKFLLVSFFTT
jgi:hypothetical protein